MAKIKAALRPSSIRWLCNLSYAGVEIVVSSFLLPSDPEFNGKLVSLLIESKRQVITERTLIILVTQNIGTREITERTYVKQPILQLIAKHSLRIWTINVIDLSKGQDL